MLDELTTEGHSATWRFQISAGVLIRGAVRREIEKGAFAWGVDLKVAESKGRLQSLYNFTATGPATPVRLFRIAAIQFFRTNHAAFEDRS